MLHRLFPSETRLLWGIGIVLLIGTAVFPFASYRFRRFQGDEATYYMIAQSLAYDGDIRYTLRDLQRVYVDFPEGPQGIFLRKGRDGNLYYAKSFAYSALVAPWFRLFGINAFPMVNIALLLLVLMAAFRYVYNTSFRTSRLWPVVFILASVLPAYVVWMTPEIMNFAAVFLSLFLLLHRTERPQHGGIARDVLGAAVGGIGVFAKPINGVVFIVATLVLWQQRAWKRLLTWAVVGSSVVLALFGVYAWVTGDWNYMGGERKTFYGRFPYQRPEYTFERLGEYHSADVNYPRELYYDARTILLDVFYYFFGRYAGIAWYFPPALIGLASAVRRRKVTDVALLLAFFLGMMVFILTQPHNYIGGGGTIANRYFLTLYPLTFFMRPQAPRLAQMVAIGAVAAVFALPANAAPFMTVLNPWRYAHTPMHRWLPVEYTQLENLPTNTLPAAFNVAFPDPRRPNYFVFFLNDAFYPRESHGFWVRGMATCELVVKRYTRMRRVRIRIRNGWIPHHRVVVQWHRRTVKMVLQPGQERVIEFSDPGGLRIRNVWMWPVRIRTTRGFIPAQVDPHSRDRRFLGVFVTIEPIDCVGCRVSERTAEAPTRM